MLRSEVTFRVSDIKGMQVQESFQITVSEAVEAKALSFLLLQKLKHLSLALHSAMLIHSFMIFRLDFYNAGQLRNKLEKCTALSQKDILKSRNSRKCIVLPIFFFLIIQIIRKYSLTRTCSNKKCVILYIFYKSDSYKFGHFEEMITHSTIVGF